MNGSFPWALYSLTFQSRTLTWLFPSSTVSHCSQHIPPTKARDLRFGKLTLGNPCSRSLTLASFLLRINGSAWCKLWLWAWYLDMFCCMFCWVRNGIYDRKKVPAPYFYLFPLVNWLPDYQRWSRSLEFTMLQHETTQCCAIEKKTLLTWQGDCLFERWDHLYPFHGAEEECLGVGKILGVFWLIIWGNHLYHKS